MGRRLWELYSKWMVLFPPSFWAWAEKTSWLVICACRLETANDKFPSPIFMVLNQRVGWRLCRIQGCVCMYMFNSIYINRKSRELSSHTFRLDGFSNWIKFHLATSPIHYFGPIILLFICILIPSRSPNHLSEPYCAKCFFSAHNEWGFLLQRIKF